MYFKIILFKTETSTKNKQRKKTLSSEKITNINGWVVNVICKEFILLYQPCFHPTAHCCDVPFCSFQLGKVFFIDQILFSYFVCLVFSFLFSCLFIFDFLVFFLTFENLEKLYVTILLTHRNIPFSIH